MKASIAVLLLILLIYAQQGKAQNDTTSVADTSYWTTGGEFSIIFNQVSLTNWSAGGESSVALGSFFSYSANFARNKVTWQNKLDLGYGFQNQDGRFNKTDDRLNLDTQFGYKLAKKWFWSSSLGLRTQFDDGFETPERDSLISRFFAPGYLLVTTGLEWKNDDNFYVVFSPVSGKFTFVLDDDLASIGAYGVDEGENSRSEFGVFLKAYFKRDIVTNVNFESKLDLFTNYIESFGDIDVNWENKFTLTVNKFLSASVFTHLIYDKDIRFNILDENGEVVGDEDKVQFKQVLGLSLNLKI